MKRWLFLPVFVAMGIAASAQTDFRSLSLQEALKVAKDEGKMVFVDFYTDWCGPCKKMAREVFPLKQVGDFLNTRFVCLKLNAEQAGREAAIRYKVNAYPTFVVLDADAKVRAELKGAMEAEGFIRKIEGMLNPDYAPERLASLYAGGDRTPEVVDRYAMSLLECRKEQEGMQVIRDYYASLTDRERLLPENAFLFTRYTVELADEKAAFMVAHRAEFDASVRAGIEEQLGKLYQAELIHYFSGYMWRSGRFRRETYEELKRQIRALGLEEKNQYAPMFRLIEGRVEGPDEEFLALCREHFDALSEVGRNTLVMNMTRLVQTEDKATLGKMAEFIRSCLPVLPPTVIVMAGRMLEDIEGRAKR